MLVIGGSFAAWPRPGRRTIPAPGPQRTTAREPVSKPVSKPRKPLPRLVAVDKRIARRVNALRPTVKKRLQRVVKKLPRDVTLVVTSARRTREEQAALRPTFGIKARPGTSTHEDGRAVDVNVLVDGNWLPPHLNEQIIGRAMASEGFRALGPSDPVHYSVPKGGVNRALVKGPLLEVPTIAEYHEMAAEAAGTLVAAGGAEPAPTN
ncbi:MAG TPA: hypothetical protein VFU47_08205 [Armatimonadota bacterium]|nr:hypothetical protein [Armatimonadota bacterium]